MKKQKVLVYLMGSLGDSIVAIPGLRAVRRHFADAEIVVLQNSESNLVTASQVIPGKLVDRYLTYRSDPGRFSKAAEYIKLWFTLRRESFDAVVYLVVSNRPEKAVRRDKLFFRSCGIGRLFGFHTVADDELYPYEPDGSPALARHEALFRLERMALDGIGFDHSDLETPLIEPEIQDLREVDEWLAAVRRRPDLPLVSIGPGCKQQVNEWDRRNFERLGAALVAEGACELIVVGGKAEFAIGEELIAAWGGGINAAGVFPVQRSAALLSRSSVHIGLDTGTTHLASAVGTRCFAIYGGRNHRGVWYPLGTGHTIVHRPVPCSPCYAFTCAMPGHPCMKELRLESIWDDLLRFRGNPASGETEVVFVR